MKRQNCYIYTRVSTAMQVDGYSLDAQKDKLRKYADFQNMFVAGEYCDEGKSGKNIGGRPEFQQMLEDIESGKDNVDFVLVFKLSRFGRNAADVLGTLQQMQDYGVNLICVEDGIDSSKDSGKLMISVLSAVAEIERENILVQTMEGRKQKAREGKWNGGFAPYGYKLVDGELKIAEDEIEVIKIIFDKYIHTNMGANGIAKYLNEHGYVKKQRQNGTLNMFASHFVKSVLNNPIYCGKIAFGRRKTEKVTGKRNEYHVVEQSDFPLYDGIHEGIISFEDWQIVRDKAAKLSFKREKIYSLEHEHLLSGILHCPICGSAMYGNVNRKKKPDGTVYKDHFYYACRHRLEIDGHKCDYHKQWNQVIINKTVEDVIKKLVSNPEFEEALQQKINSRVDTSSLEAELDAMNKQLQQYIGAKRKLTSQMDSLDIFDKHYDMKYQDMQSRLDNLYDTIALTENSISEQKEKIANIIQNKINRDKVYQFLLMYDIIYDKLSDTEKKRFLNCFIESVEIYSKEQPDGRILKSITFNFPIFYDGEEINNICWKGDVIDETVVSLVRKIPDTHIDFEINLDELDLTAAESKATYQEIKDYVYKKFRIKVSSLNISQVKTKCGIIERENYNKGKDGHRVPNCSPEKEKAIMDAFNHFQMI